MIRSCFRLLACLWVVGCAEVSSSGTGGVVTDSAGIRMVDIPQIPRAPTRSLEVDTVWMQEVALEVDRLGDVEPLSDGGAVLLDEMSGVITALSSDGEVVTEFGRLGEGPGEFSPAGGISRIVMTDSSLLVPDIQLQRVTEFSLRGDVLAIHPMPGGAVYGVDWRAHPDGGILFRALSPAGDLILWARDQTVDTLHIFDIRSSGPNRLLPPTPIWDMDHEGRLILARSDQGQIEARRPGQETPVWLVRWETGTREVSAGARVHLEDLLLASAEEDGLGSLPTDQRQRILSSVTFPDSVPVVASVLADPRGRIWVQEAASISAMGMEALRVGRAAGFGGTAWRVLGEDGSLEGLVTMPRAFTSRRFVGDCMYGILEDDLGLRKPARVCTN